MRKRAIPVLSVLFATVLIPHLAIAQPTASVMVMTDDGSDSQFYSAPTLCPPPALCSVEGFIPLPAYTSPAIQAQVVGSPGNDGHAKIGSSQHALSGNGVAMGVEVQTSGTARFHTARADFSDVWTGLCPAGSTCGVDLPPLPPPSFPVLTSFRIGGTVDNTFIAGGDSSFMELQFTYNAYDDVSNLVESLSMNLCYDSGPCGQKAFLNGVDVSNQIVFVQKATGDWDVSFNATTMGFRSFNGWRDELSAKAEIDGSGDHLIDLLSTFHVDVTSLDPNVVWQSQTGRQSAAQNACASDTTPPTITAPPSVSASAGSSCSAFVSDAILGTASATDNCGGVTVDRSGVPSGNVFPIGTTVITHTAKDSAGNTASVTQAVMVIDDTRPTIACPSDISVSNSPGLCAASVTITLPTATDNCGAPTVNGVRSDGQPLAAAFPVGTTTITWTATDAAGNRNACSHKITVKDTEPPALNVPPAITAEFVNENGAAMTYVVTSSDNCPGVTQSCAPASGSTFPIATTPVQCTALDAHNNVTTKTFSVIVLGALGVKQDVLADLKRLGSSEKAIEHAIDDLQDSLDPENWIDETHVREAEVFQKEKDSVNQLTNVIRKHGGDATLQGFVDRIVKSDRLLCTFAINEATTNTEAYAEAVRLRAKGDQMVANGQYESAIEQYRNAWSKVEER